MLRSAAAALALIACSGPVTPAVAPVGSPAVASAPTSSDAGAAADAAPQEEAELDSDRDGLVDRCDRCPSETEVYNGLTDDDGCPDGGRGGGGHGPDPTQQYSRPRGVVGGVLLMQRRDVDLDHLTQEQGLEELACVVKVAPGAARPALRRAEVLAAERCADLVRRAGYPIATQARVTAAPTLLGSYRWADDLDLVVVVTRARGVQVWRWTGADFERATPLATTPTMPPLPGCE